MRLPVAATRAVGSSGAERPRVVRGCLSCVGAEPHPALQSQQRSELWAPPPRTCLLVCGTGTALIPAT